MLGVGAPPLVGLAASEARVHWLHVGVLEENVVLHGRHLVELGPADVAQVGVGSRHTARASVLQQGVLVEVQLLALGALVVADLEVLEVDVGYEGGLLVEGSFAELAAVGQRGLPVPGLDVPGHHPPTHGAVALRADVLLLVVHGLKVVDEGVAVRERLGAARALVAYVLVLDLEVTAEAGPGLAGEGAGRGGAHEQPPGAVFGQRALRSAGKLPPGSFPHNPALAHRVHFVGIVDNKGPQLNRAP